MEAWRPADLEVVDVLGGRIEAQLERDPLQRLFGLHDLDRRLEVADVLDLARAVVGRDHPQAGATGQFLRGQDAHSAVEVQIQRGRLPATTRTADLSAHKS